MEGLEVVKMGERQGVEDIACTRTEEIRRGINLRTERMGEQR
jgi:hypothetical protein